MGCCAAANSQNKQQNKDGQAADPQILEINRKESSKLDSKSPLKSAEKSREKVVADDSDGFDESLELTETEAHSKPMQVQSKTKSNNLRGENRQQKMLMIEIADKLNYLGGAFPPYHQPSSEYNQDSTEISSMPGQLQYDTIGQLLIFKTFSEKYLCHQPAINAKNFSNYLYYVPMSQFNEDPNDPSKWIIGLDQQYPVNLDFAIGSVCESTNDTETIVFPMFDKQYNSEILEQLPVPENLHQQFDQLYTHLDETNQKYRTGAVTALEIPMFENKECHLVLVNLPEPSQTDYLANLKIALLNLFDVIISLGKQQVQISLEGAIGNEDSVRVIIYYLVYICNNCNIPSMPSNKLQSITLICKDEEERLKFYRTIGDLQEAWNK